MVREERKLMPDGGRCTLTKKSLGRGGEVMILQGEDIQAILKLSLQQPSGEILDKTRFIIEFKKDFIISSKLTNRQKIFGNIRNM